MSKIDPYSGELKRTSPGAGPLVIQPLPWNLLYTKSQVDALIAKGGGSGIVKSVVAGANVTVDSTDPANPIVSASASSGVSKGFIIGMATAL